MRRSLLILLPAAALLVSCDSRGDKLGKHYLTLKAAGASAAELCLFSSDVAKAYFEEPDMEQFLVWEETRKADCAGQATAAAGTEESRPPSQPAPSPDAKGAIAGTISFPSDYIPKDMQVCVRETASGEESCTAVGNGPAYSLSLFPGTYVVWATTKEFPNPAYYSKAVACGLEAQCTDHSPIEVVVAAGQTARGIDPGDWYANQ
jgi:hypothetical protein